MDNEGLCYIGYEETRAAANKTMNELRERSKIDFEAVDPRDDFFMGATES